MMHGLLVIMQPKFSDRLSRCGGGRGGPDCYYYYYLIFVIHVGSGSVA